MSGVCVRVLLLSFCASAAPSSGAAPAEESSAAKPCGETKSSMQPALDCVRSACGKGTSVLEKILRGFTVAQNAFNPADPEPLLRPTKDPDASKTPSTADATDSGAQLRGGRPLSEAVSPATAPVLFLRLCPALVHECGAGGAASPAEKSGCNEEKKVNNNVSFPSYFSFFLLQDQRDLWVR